MNLMIDKKKLKEDYKNMIPPKGIFIIKNNETGRVFLGSSPNLNGTLDKNRMMLNAGIHRNTRLQEDWKQSGEKGFTLEISEVLKLKDDPNYNYEEDLQILELIWLEKYQPLLEKCYNKNEKIRTV